MKEYNVERFRFGQNFVLRGGPSPVQLSDQNSIIPLSQKRVWNLSLFFRRFNDMDHKDILFFIGNLKRN